MFEKIVEVGLLFDFYGKLLSAKQYTAIELYYIHDLSLSEIGEQLNISRQGVHDLIKRSEKRLYKYEDTLGLINKFNEDREKVREILEYIRQINEEKDLGISEFLGHLKNIELIALDILESSQEVK